MNEKKILLTKISYFITKKYGPNETIDENSRIEEDLGITGDEAWEFLIEYGKSFNVDVSNFMAADYFKAEGFDFITPILEFLKLKKKIIKKTLTINDLIKGIIAGKLDEDVINTPCSV